MRNRFARALGCILMVAFSGCAAEQHLTADQYFDEASSNFQAGAYPRSVELYREMLDQYPFSPHSEDAELLIGHAHYLNNSCPEAVAVFTDFQRRHPTSPYLPFVAYLLGRCYEKQMRPADRDQSASQNANIQYLGVTQQFPDSPFSDLAHEDMERCRGTLAEHELLIASFYNHQGNRKAAEFRLLDLVNRFQDTDVAASALYQLGGLYEVQGSKEEAILSYAAVTEHYPDDELAPKARARLAALAPDEELPVGDPLVVLRAQTGRSRTLALAQIVKVPGLDAPGTPGAVPAASPGLGLPSFGGFNRY